MKKTTTLMVSMLLLGALGCSSTVTLGPKANEKNGILNAKIGEKGVGVTVPFIDVSVSPAGTKEGTQQTKKETTKNKK